MQWEKLREIDIEIHAKRDIEFFLKDLVKKYDLSENELLYLIALGNSNKIVQEIYKEKIKKEWKQRFPEKNYG